MDDSIELTTIEETELWHKVLEMDSLTEKWEQELCFSMMVEAVKWGKKIDLVNKSLRKKR